LNTTILDPAYLPEEEAFAPTYDAIPKLPRIPLWPQHLYRGTVAMYAGASGTGKGMTGVHAAAVVTRGGLFPGEHEDSRPNRTPGSVLGIWPEDDPNEDLAYRLDSALAGEGADLRHVYDMTETAEGEPFDLNNGGHDSVARLSAAIDSLQDCDGGEYRSCACGKGHEEPRWPVLLVIIDPLLAVTETVSTNRSARRTMSPLMTMAKRTGVAVMVIHHTVKDGRTIAGSKGLVDVLRLVFKMERQEPGSDVIVMSVEKANNIGQVGDLRYKLAGTEDAPYLEWIEARATGPASAPSWRTRGTQPIPATTTKNADDGNARLAKSLVGAVRAGRRL
jgi:RecA-family ATPase